VEEGSRGGFGSFVLHFLNDKGLLDSGLKVRTLCLPDEFQEQDSVESQYEKSGLSAGKIARACRD
jgi:1-deoxy-D-xylulose-5-phosphate synthase